MMQTQAVIEFARREPLDADTLNNLADVVLEALNRDARFVAFGPVVSVNYARSALEVECTICTSTTEEVDAVIDRLHEIIGGAIASTEYATSAERVPVPA